MPLSAISGRAPDPPPFMFTPGATSSLGEEGAFAVSTQADATAPPMAQGAAGANHADGGETSAEEKRAQEAMVPNPRIWLDSALGLVVLEFRNLRGEVSSSIPSPRQLAAYRANAITAEPLPPGIAPLSAKGATTAEGGAAGAAPARDAGAGDGGPRPPRSYSNG